MSVRGWGWGVALAIGGACAVPTTFIDPTHRACDAQKPCPSGWTCTGDPGVCASTDAGSDAGTADAGPEGGPDAGFDAGADAGVDAGMDGGAGCLATFAPSGRVQAGSGASTLAVGDFNHDGLLDLVTIDSATGGVALLLNGGSGQLTVDPTLTNVSISPQGCGPLAAAAVASGDFNADGWTDVAVSVPANDSFGVLLNDHDGGFTAGGAFGFEGPSACLAQFPPPFTPLAVCAIDGGQAIAALDTDLNATGLALLAVYQSGALLFDGGGYRYSSFASMPSGLTAADLNRDGQADLGVLVNPGGTAVRIDVLLSGPGGPSTQELTAGPQTSDLRFADMNGDGLDDLVFVDSQENAVGILFAVDAGVFGDLAAVTFSTVIGSQGTGPLSLVVADLDRDGKLDVATVGATSVTIMKGMPDSGLLAVETLPTPVGSAGVAAYIVAADLVGDGGAAPWLAIAYSANTSAAAQNEVDLFRSTCR